MNNQPACEPPILALDFANPTQADALVRRLSPELCRLKVGKELFVRSGPEPIRRWVADGWDVFLDLKFHDIPNTVAAACQAAAELGVWMINVHALGGAAMMAAAREALEPLGPQRPWLIAVTVLTSHDAQSLEAIGLSDPPAAAVARLVALTHNAGLDGVVCSAQEATAVRAQTQAAFRRVTPGIRPAGSAQDDQRRIMTPAAALAGGATDLVVGRPITRADDPVAALTDLRAEMGLT
jgi:orotidine-5'-phosphate decarboxylase